MKVHCTMGKNSKSTGKVYYKLKSQQFHWNFIWFSKTDSFLACFLQEARAASASNSIDID